MKTKFTPRLVALLAMWALALAMLLAPSADAADPTTTNLYAQTQRLGLTPAAGVASYYVSATRTRADATDYIVSYPVADISAPLIVDTPSRASTYTFRLCAYFTNAAHKCSEPLLTFRTALHDADPCPPPEGGSCVVGYSDFGNLGQQFGKCHNEKFEIPCDWE